jgi:hypothetical protein
VVVTGFDVNRDLFVQARNSQEINKAMKPAARPRLRIAHA